MPQAAGVVCHGVEWAREVMMTGHVAMRALVHEVEAEQIGAGCSQSRGALGSPGQRCAVVASYPYRAFLNVTSLDKHIFVGDSARQFQVGRI